MLFDCGHNAEIGRMHRQGVLCIACSNAVSERGRITFVPPLALRNGPQSPVMIPGPDIKAAISLIKKRLPSEWSLEKVEQFAQRMIRAQTVRGRVGSKSLTLLNDRLSPKSQQRGKKDVS